MRSSPVRAVLTLGVAMLATIAGAEDMPKSVTMNAATLEYIKVPDLPECATAAILRGNPRNGPAWVLLKLATGCRVPAHWHTANEDMVVISGRGSIAMRDGGPPLEFTPGAYASLPSHHVHQATCLRSCLLFSAADAAFDIHYVDAGGKGISFDDAMKQPVRTKPHRRGAAGRR